MNKTQPLLCISSLDGRYHEITNVLSPYFSEYALIKKRVTIEIRYLLELSQRKVIRDFTQKEKDFLQTLITEFVIADAEVIKQLEATYKHDVKAVEYFLREKLEKTTLQDITQYIHFGLTSEDVNNLSISIMLHEANQHVIVTQIKQILEVLKQAGLLYKETPMLALTHGQPAVPTTFSKELAVYYQRIKHIFTELKQYSFEGKLNGAVGNYNALQYTFPEVDWMQFSHEFITSLGLSQQIATTQILPADNMVRYFDLIKLINTICMDLCQDMWMYISRDILMIKKEKDQVGSSTMPQKVNPISFENAEGNFYVANALLEMYSRKLPISRMQRDLTDSTIKRTFGTAIGHTLLALSNLEKGLKQIQVNEKTMADELVDHPEVLAEGLQVYLKKQGDQKGYEKIQKFFQGKKVLKEDLEKLMNELNIDSKSLTTTSYIGLAKELTERILHD